MTGVPAEPGPSPDLYAAMLWVVHWVAAAAMLALLALLARRVLRPGAAVTLEDGSLEPGRATRPRRPGRAHEHRGRRDGARRRGQHGYGGRHQQPVDRDRDVPIGLGPGLGPRASTRPPLDPPPHVGQRQTGHREPQRPAREEHLGRPVGHAGQEQRGERRGRSGGLAEGGRRRDGLAHVDGQEDDADDHQHAGHAGPGQLPPRRWSGVRPSRRVIVTEAASPATPTAGVPPRPEATGPPGTRPPRLGPPTGRPTTGGRPGAPRPRRPVCRPPRRR